mgnify:CR=1 FL=1
MTTATRTDLETTSARGAAFNKPAYRYLRVSDNLPAIGSESPTALVKLFDPTGSWTWYISEYDTETREAFGLVDGFEAELGYISMPELVAFRGRFGLPLERDLHWTPRPLSECAR